MDIEALAGRMGIYESNKSISSQRKEKGQLGGSSIFSGGDEISISEEAKRERHKEQAEQEKLDQKS